MRIFNQLEKKNITIISKLILPYQSPRSFRATELAKELARQGHNVVLYAALGKYNYQEFEKRYKLKIRSIGKTKFLEKNSDGMIIRSYWIQYLSNTFLDGYSGDTDPPSGDIDPLKGFGFKELNDLTIFDHNILINKTAP
jgi:hypothetical protein